MDDDDFYFYLFYFIYPSSLSCGKGNSGSPHLGEAETPGTGVTSPQSSANPGKLLGVYTLHLACMCNVRVIHLTGLLWPSLPNSGWAF